MIPPIHRPRADMAQIDDDAPPAAGAWIAVAVLAIGAVILTAVVWSFS
jgi:hypothetical protein